MSLSQLATAVHYDKGHLSRVETGKKPPTEELARACDNALQARGDLLAAAHMDVAAARDTNPWQTAELLRRVQASDTTPGTLASLEATTFDLCAQYSYRKPPELRAEAQDWLQHVGTLLRKPVGLNAHRELLVSAGWLALLIGCLEYDMGMRAAAEATRTAAMQLGHEAGQSEIVGWSHEMASWFALTQGRYHEAVVSAQAGQDADPHHSVVVQLIIQEARALARMDDKRRVREALERGRSVLDSFPIPTRTNHFVVNPAKWDFYAMDAYRLAGDDELAREHALQVVANAPMINQQHRAPMRVAEAQLTLAVVAARNGELDQAVHDGMAALEKHRRSLPSLLPVASELDAELSRRFPDHQATHDFREVLRSLR